MAYLGRGLDKISNIEILDNITFDGSSSYSITKGSVAFTPNSAQSCLISIDGVVQATNFTVNSSTIDFGVAIPSTSVCNFFLHYGTGVLTVPSDGSVTTAKLGDGSVTSAKLSSGKILNVVNDSDTTNTVVSSTTYADTGLSASITPSSTSNKILIIISQDFAIENTSSTNNVTGGFKLLRDSTTLYTGSDDGNSFGVRYFNTVGSGSQGFNNVWNYTFFDTPSSTSSITYKTQCRTYDTNSRFRLNNQINGTSKSFITLMEIAG